MKLAYARASAAQSRGGLRRPFRVVAGATLLLAIATARQLSQDIVPDEEWVQMALHFIVLPMTACAGTLLLADALSASRLGKLFVIGRAAFYAAALAAVIGTVPLLPFGTADAVGVLRMILVLLAGTLLHVVLGGVLWHLGRRVLAAQMFGLALALPVVAAAPFVGTGATARLGRSYALSVQPAVGTGCSALQLVWEVAGDIARHPLRTSRAVVDSARAEPYFFAGWLVTVWAIVAMAWLVVVALLDGCFWLRRSKRRRVPASA